MEKDIEKKVENKVRKEETEVERGLEKGRSRLGGRKGDKNDRDDREGNRFSMGGMGGMEGMRGDIVRERGRDRIGEDSSPGGISLFPQMSAQQPYRPSPVASEGLKNPPLAAALV